MRQGPKRVVGDGARGFWDALREVCGETGGQRCRVHKRANVLNQMPKGLQAKGHLQDIWMAKTGVAGEGAFDVFLEACGVTDDKAVERLVNDRERWLTFHDFAAEHWQTHPHHQPHREHMRHGAPANREDRNCLSPKPARAMVFKLILSAKAKWRKLDGSSHLAKVVEEVPSRDGIKQIKHAA